MIDLIVLIAIGIAIFLIWSPAKKHLTNQNKKKEDPRTANLNSDEKRIFSLKINSVLKINQAGENLEDLDLKVLSKNLYTQGSYEWIEYELTNGIQKYWLAVEYDDEISLAFTFDKDNLQSLGINKNRLQEIDKQEEGKILYRGKNFYYEDSDGAVFFKNSDQSLREEFYYWEFEEQKEEYFVTVENWSGSYEVSFGKYIKQRQIEFYN